MLTEMKQPIRIIYVPGFGPKYQGFRVWALGLWRYRNVTVEVLDSDWPNGTFRQKLALVDDAIDRAKGLKVVLIGESAGGSLVLHAYSRRPADIYRVLTLCGKNVRPETVNQRYFTYSPAFQTSITRVPEVIDGLDDDHRKRITVIHPLHDPLVSIDDQLIPGARRARLLSVGHLFTIILALTVYSPVLVRAARR